METVYLYLAASIPKSPYYFTKRSEEITSHYIWPPHMYILWPTYRVRNFLISVDKNPFVIAVLFYILI